MIRYAALVATSWSGALASAAGLSFLFAAAAAALGEPARPTATETLAERERLTAEEFRLRAAGEFAQAIDVGEQLLALELRVLKSGDHDIVGSLEFLAQTYQRLDDWPRSIERYEAALARRREYQGDEHWATAETLAQLNDARRIGALSPNERAPVKAAFEALDDAAALAKAGKFDEAIDAAARALAIQEEKYGSVSIACAQALNRLVGLHLQRGDYAGAESLVRREREIWSLVIGVPCPGYAWACNDLGSARERQDDLAGASASYREALDCYDQMEWPNDAELLFTVDNLARAYAGLSDYDRAEPLYRRALAIREELGLTADANYAKNLQRLGLAYTRLGQFALALARYQAALELRKQVLGEDDPLYAETLASLSILYEHLGDYPRAEQACRQAIEIIKRAPGDHRDEHAGMLNDLSGLYLEQGDYERAEQNLLDALALWSEVEGEDTETYAVGLNNLGGIYLRWNQLDLAEEKFTTALELRQRLLRDGHRDIALSMHNLAMVYAQDGRFDLAEPLYLKALAIRKEELGDGHPDVATNLESLAIMYFKWNRWDEAEQYARQGSAIRKTVLGEKHPEYAGSLGIVARILLARGEFESAAELYRQAMGISQEWLNATAAARDELGQLRLYDAMQGAVYDYVDCLLHLPHQDATAYDALVRLKGSTTVRQRAARQAGVDQRLQAVVRQWTALAKSNAPSNPKLRASFRQLTEDKERLEAELSARSAEYRRATKAPGAGAVAQSLPEDVVLVDYYKCWYSIVDEAAYGPPPVRSIYVAFVIRSSAPDGGDRIQMYFLGDAGEIERAIDQWRDSYGLKASGHEAAYFLRNRIWATLGAAIGDARTVLVSPDAALGTLPFGALPGDVPGTFLIDERQVAVVPVPQLIPELLQAAAPTEKLSSMLLVGNVDYNDRALPAAGPASDRGPSEAPRPESEHSSTNQPVATAAPGDVELAEEEAGRGAVARALRGRWWRPLKGTADEIRDIGELYTTAGGESRRVEVLDEARATEERFRELAPQFDVLHIATHGFFEHWAAEDAISGSPWDDRGRRLPLGVLSGLILAGANKPPAIPADLSQLALLPEDGVLTAEELGLLRLENVRLAVLSACESALGKSADGEGMLGIQRAFQVAGARTTIASLWPVDDRETQRLMTSFYRHALVEGRSPLEALHAAQLEFVNEWRAGDPTSWDDYRSPGSPFFWAAFTLSGDWR